MSECNTYDELVCPLWIYVTNFEVLDAVEPVWIKQNGTCLEKPLD